MIRGSLLAIVAGFFAWSIGRANFGPRNPGVIVIDHPEVFSQVLAISDVHGMYLPVLNLLRRGGIVDGSNRWIGGSTLLVIVGDTIDKGPQSLELLDLWISLTAQAQASGGRVVHLLGNHEAEFLANPANDKADELVGELQTRGLPMTELTSPARPWGNFLTSLPAAAIVGKWLFCHSGFYPAMSWNDFGVRSMQLLNQGKYSDPFFLAPDSFLEAKKWEPLVPVLLDRLNHIGLSGVVFGHQPRAFGVEGRSAALAGGRLIKIDNGMAPEGGEHPGSLVRFSAPALMNQPGFPPMTVMTADGAIHPLRPE